MYEDERQWLVDYYESFNDFKIYNYSQFRKQVYQNYTIQTLIQMCDDNPDVSPVVIVDSFISSMMNATGSDIFSICQSVAEDVLYYLLKLKGGKISEKN